MPGVFGLALLILGPVLSEELTWPGAFAVEARAFTDQPDAQRLRAIERLAAKEAAYGAAPVKTLLTALLADQEASIRLYAARRLVRAGEPAAIAAATAWITKPTVPIIDRSYGLDVLREAPELPLSARRAVERALRDPDAAIRSQALETLERHDVRPTLPTVLAVLDDESREVRLRAVRLAGATADERAALPLLARLEDVDRPIRVEAIRSLAAFPRAIPALLRIAHEAQDETGVAAVDALGVAKAEAALPLLAGLAGRRPADDLVRHAQNAVAKLGTAAAAAVLANLIRTPPVPGELIEALRGMGDVAVPPLIRELGSGPPNSAAIAAGLLGELGDRRATAALCAVVDDGRRAAIVPIAIDALARLADPAAVPALARAAESPDLETRRRAFAALLEGSDARAVAVLDRGFSDPDPHVRRLAANLAGALDTRAAATSLATLMADRDRQVRRAAAVALAQVGAPSPTVSAAVLGALLQSGAVARARDDWEWQLAGDALERVVDAADGPKLIDALRAAAAGPAGARAALARGLAVAYAGRPLADQATIERLVAMLPAGDPPALAAADALAAARLPAESRGALSQAFAVAAPAVRARLCGALGAMPDGGRWLAGVIEATEEPEEVRAAAAWAARGQDDARGALTAAAAADGFAAANARAALGVWQQSRRKPATPSWLGVRVRAVNGVPEAGRWLSISGAGGVTVWVMTDAEGGARLHDLSEGAVDVRVNEALVRPAPPPASLLASPSGP